MVTNFLDTFLNALPNCPCPEMTRLLLIQAENYLVVNL